MLVISPHFDDAVFACGRQLASHPGSTVVTVFAGMPTDAAQTTEWDARCGFASAEDAVQSRRAEDREALALLDARPLWLGFVDSQYGEPAAVKDIREAIAQLVKELSPSTLLFPLGLFHSDHAQVHEACLGLLKQLPDKTRPVAYEDALYRSMPGLLQQRLVALAKAKLSATPEPPPADGDAHAARKSQAVQCYASQLRAFGRPSGPPDTHRPERCWALEAVHAG